MPREKPTFLKQFSHAQLGKAWEPFEITKLLNGARKTQKLNLKLKNALENLKLKYISLKQGKKQLKSIQCQLNELANCLANFDVFSSRQTNLNLLKKVQKIAEDLWTYLFRKFQKHTLTYLINMKKLFHQETNFWKILKIKTTSKKLQKSTWTTLKISSVWLEFITRNLPNALRK